MPKPTKREIEESENPDVKAIAADLDAYASLDAVATSPGGQLLIKSHLKDVVSSVERLCNGYAGTLSHIEMIAICADMKSKLDMVQSLGRASMNKDDAEKALEQALLES